MKVDRHWWIDRLLFSWAIACTTLSGASARDGQSFGTIIAGAIMGLALGLAWQRLRSNRAKPANRNSKAKRRRSSLAIALFAYLIEGADRIAFCLLTGWSVGLAFAYPSSVNLLVAMAIAGMVLLARLIVHWAPSRRRKLVTGIVTIVLAATASGLFLVADLWQPEQPILAGSMLAFATLLVYIVMFCGQTEETDLEVGVLAIIAGMALSTLPLPVTLRNASVLLPLALFFLYSSRAQRGINHFKSMLRGILAEDADDKVLALRQFQLALRLTPSDKQADQGIWRIHQSLTVDDLTRDPAFNDLVDPVVCFSRAKTLRQSNQADDWTDADRLLDLVSAKRNDLGYVLAFERIQLACNRGNAERAFALAQPALSLEPNQLSQLPDHEFDAVFQTWRYLQEEPLLLARYGHSLLDDPALLLRFSAVIERRLQQVANDPKATAFRPFVTRRLTRALLQTWLDQSPGRRIDWLDPHYVFDLAKGLLDDPTQSQQAQQLCDVVDFLIERGDYPSDAPLSRLLVWREQAFACERRADTLRERQPDEARSMLARADALWQQVAELGLATPRDQRQAEEQLALDTALKRVSQFHERTGDFARAAEMLAAFVAGPNAGIESIRKLYGLFLKTGNYARAVWPIELALGYQLSDADRTYWLEEKAAVYRKLKPDQVLADWPKIRSCFDRAHCLEQARTLFAKKADPSPIEHYVNLAAIGDPDDLLGVNVLLGRLRFADGKVADAVACFESAISAKPKSFADTQQRDDYYLACRLAGDLYLDHLQQYPRAAELFEEYSKSSKSGGETLYRLGRAHELAGNNALAQKAYKSVLVYADHPRSADAKAALQRLGAS